MEINFLKLTIYKNEKQRENRVENREDKKLRFIGFQLYS